MSATAALLTLFTLLIGLMLRLDRAGSTMVADRETVGRLATLFRADVRASTAARRAQDNNPPAPSAQPAAGARPTGKQAAKKAAVPAPNEADLVLELPAGRTVRYHLQAGELL